MDEKNPLDFVLNYGHWGEVHRAEVCPHGLPPGGCRECIRRALGRLGSLYLSLSQEPRPTTEDPK